MLTNKQVKTALGWKKLGYFQRKNLKNLPQEEYLLKQWGVKTKQRVWIMINPKLIYTPSGTK